MCVRSGLQAWAHWLFAPLGLFLLWVPGSSLAQTTLSEIQILKTDQPGGVPSEVYFLHTDGTTSFIDETDMDGNLILQEARPCSQGMRLKVDSGSSHYRDEDQHLVQCTVPEIVLLERIHYTSLAYAALALSDTTEDPRILGRLASNVDTAVAADDFALAAQLYNEMASRLAPVDNELADDFSSQAASAWARAGGFPGTPVARDGGSILTQDFRAYVTQYQQSVGIESTGHLDYRTLESLADRKIYWFLYDVYPEPITVPRISEQFECARLTLGDLALGKSPLVASLIRTADEMESTGKYGNAALLFNEAHARVVDDPEVAIFLEQRVYENAGRELKTLDPARCDPIQGRFVMSPQMVEAVRARQQDQPTGILDYKTLRSLADIDVASFLGQQPD